jgi:hypothetical protein
MSSIVTRQEWPTVLSEVETSLKPRQEAVSIAWQTWQLGAMYAKSLPPFEACAKLL